MYRKTQLNLGTINTYTIDINGVVYNVTKQKYLKGTSITSNNRYVKIHLDKKFYPLHRLVMETFSPNPNPTILTQINHIDGNRYNNALDNLEWCTAKQNIQHCWSNNMHIHQQGEINGFHKLTNEDIKKIWSLRNTNLTAQQIQKRLRVKVSLTTIKKIRTSKSWGWLTSTLD